MAKETPAMTQVTPDTECSKTATTNDIVKELEKKHLKIRCLAAQKKNNGEDYR